MPNTTDKRFKKCEERIQTALVKLLASKPLTEIGVSELSREAHVSRATFYAHYENVGDVYDQLVQKAMTDVQPLSERFACDRFSCDSSGKPTYCERIRSGGDLSGVIKDPRFFPAMMEIGRDTDLLSDYAARTGISKDLAEVVMLFQMSGCHAVATSKFAQRSDWPQIRELIDQFIEGGMSALGKR